MLNQIPEMIMVGTKERTGMGEELKRVQGMTPNQFQEMLMIGGRKRDIEGMIQNILQEKTEMTGEGTEGQLMIEILPPTVREREMKVANIIIDNNL